MHQAKRIDSPRRLDSVISLTPCMPCSFGLLPHPRSGMRAQPTGLREVTVTDRYIPLVTAAYGTRVARPAKDDARTWWRRAPS